MKIGNFLRFAHILSILLCVAGLAGCAIQKKTSPTAPSTPDVTQALQTIAALLTQTAALTPGKSIASATVAPPTPIATTSSSTQSLLPEGSPTGPVPTHDPSCDRAAPGNPIDKTIDDDTPMQPGQKFTKIWVLVNDGTCTWTRDYQAVWFFGEQFGETLAVPLIHEVAPGESVEIAVDMTAPTTPDVYQGNWMLRNATGADFGIGPAGESPFWLRISVVETATATPTHTVPPSRTLTPTPSPTFSPSPTLTPPSLASGSLLLMPNDLLNLDSSQINPAVQPDLAYLADANLTHWLTPQNGALLGVYGLSQPSPADCREAAMGDAPIAVESLSPGIYLCYLTDEDNSGWLSLITFRTTDFAIQVELLTWAP